MKSLCIIMLSFFFFQGYSQIDSLPRIAYDFLPPVQEWNNITDLYIGAKGFYFTNKEREYEVDFDSKGEFSNISIKDTFYPSTSFEELYFLKKYKRVQRSLFDENGIEIAIENYFYENDTLERKSISIDENYITTYFDCQGNIEEMYYYEKGKAVKTEIFYTSGQLSTLFLYEKARIISVTQFDPKGKKIEDVFVDKKGNGRWFMCSEDGTYCCDCEVKRGKTFGCEEYIDNK